MDKTTPMKAKPLVNVTCKLGAKGCFEDGRCHALGRCENKIETNADRIRSMSDEELADMLHNIDSYIENGNLLVDIWLGEDKSTVDDSFGFLLKWLQSEVKGSDV